MEAFNMTSDASAAMFSYRLSELLADLLVEKSLSDDCANTVVTGIATDSRKVVAGDVFIALNGLTVDGRNFIDDAVKRGAVAVLAEADESFSIRKQV